MINNNNNNNRCILIILINIIYILIANAYISSKRYDGIIKASPSSSLVLSSSSSTSTIATLDGNTLWEIKLLLRKENLPSYSVSAILRVRFLESINFEPPQGYVLVEDDLNGLVKVNEKNLTSTFKLSEDINDR